MICLLYDKNKPKVENVVWQFTDAFMVLDFHAFEDAAEEFHPHIKFFATFSAKVKTLCDNKDLFDRLDLFAW